MRLTFEQRRAVIVTAAVREARSRGLANVCHGDVAKRCSLPTTERTVRHYFSSRKCLWSAVIAAAPDFAEQGKELGL